MDHKYVRSHFRTEKVQSNVEEVIGMVKYNLNFRGHDFECSVESHMVGMAEHRIVVGHRSNSVQ